MTARRVAQILSRTTIAILVASVLLVGVAIAPFLFGWLRVGDRVDWLRLSEIGQSYGVASAALSALALCAVAAAAVLQARQARASQVYGARSFHLELLKLAIDRPEYRAALGLDFDALGADRWPLHAYINLWMMYLQTSFLTASISAVGLRRILADEIFGGPAGLAYWPRARSAFRAEAQSRRHDRFLRIVEEEYTRAGALTSSRQSGPPYGMQSGVGPTPRRSWGSSGIVVAMVSAGVVTLVVQRRRRRKRP